MCRWRWRCEGTGIHARTLSSAPTRIALTPVAPTRIRPLPLDSQRPLDVLRGQRPPLAATSHPRHTQANALPLDKTVLQTVQAASAAMEHTYEDLRALLGRFMFKVGRHHSRRDLNCTAPGPKAPAPRHQSQDPIARSNRKTHPNKAPPQCRAATLTGREGQLIVLFHTIYYSFSPLAGREGQLILLFHTIYYSFSPLAG